MKIEISRYKAKGFEEVVVRHGDEELFWRAKPFSRISLTEDPFYEINLYFKELDVKRQDRIFKLYQEIHDDLSISDDMSLYYVLMKNVTALYKEVDVAQLHQWLVTRPTLNVPNSILEKENGYNSAPPEQTYKTADYIELTALSIVVRPMVPIWGLFGQILDEGKRNYFSLELINLMEKTAVPKLAGYTKLMEYCTKSVEVNMKENDILDMGLAGLAPAEIPAWVQSMVIYRKLTTIPILNADPVEAEKKHIVSVVYYFVNGETEYSKRPITDRTRRKPFTEGNGSEEDKNSILEFYKTKKRIPEGDLVLLEVYSERVADMVKRVDPTVPDDIIQDCVYHSSQMASVALHPHQISISQWALAEVLSPKAIKNMSKGARLNVLAASQALVWHWGFPDLAAFLSVDREWSTMDMNPQLGSAPIPRPRLTRETHDALTQLYPFERIASQKRDGTISMHNFATNEIELITRSLHQYRWIYLGPRKLLDLTNQPRGRQVMVVPLEIKKRLTELAIVVGQRHQ